MTYKKGMSEILQNFHYTILGPSYLTKGPDQNSSDDSTREAASPQRPERVVFVHGLMAFAANWRKIASRLQNDFECLIFDQRGHGRSFKPETGYALTDFANDLLNITQALGWNEFHLVGHSMGARNSMVFAYLHPEKVKTLTLEDMGPENNQKALDYYRRMLEFIPTPFASKEAMKQVFDSVFISNFKAKEPMTVLASFLQANIEEKSEGPNSGLYDWKFSKSAVYEIVEKGNSRDLWVETASFKMPVLLIRGENSHVLTSEVFERMQQVNSNIRGVEFKGASHWVHYEKSEEFVTCLREFILQHSSFQSN